MFVAVLACSALLVGAAAPAAADGHPKGGGHHGGKAPEVLLEGLSSPKGLAVNTEGDLVIAQGAFGPPGPVLVFDRDTGTAEPVTEPFNVTDVAISPVDGTGWAIAGTRAVPPARRRHRRPRARHRRVPGR